MGGLIRNTALVGGMTLLSRILGFVRDLALGRLFGAGVALDAFFVAFRIPNLLRRFFGEGAFSLAFVPVLSEYRVQRTPAEVRVLIARVFGTLAAVLAVLTLVGVLAAPLLMMLFGMGWYLDGDPQYPLATSLLRIVFPYILFISLVAFAAGILNTWGRFGLPAFAPVLLNLCLITAAYFWRGRPHALAWAVFAAGLLQLGLLLAALYRMRLLPWPVWGWGDPGVRRILGLMGPAILGSSVAQINLLFDSLIASFLVTGSVSWLYFADRLVEFPLGVFGVALSTVILPSLSREHAAEDRARFRSLLDQALRWVWLLGAPATLGLLLLAGPIIVTLFQYDRFTPHQAAMVSLALRAYALGLPAFLLVKVLAPGFYARQDTRTPVRVGMLAMGVNMGLNLVFVLSLVGIGFEGPHAGLALATACSSWLNAALLYRRLRRAGVYAPEPGWRGVWVRVCTGLAVMGAILATGPEPMEVWLHRSGGERAFWLGAWVLAAAAAYLAILRLLGVRLELLWRRPE
ncbi:MAG: murein biosynthesis integral membrane protein MurJ [Gammaproteobacteria bacterium]|nr:MAG: murein biosynthesis integral membrane protein MurJ [Gammaproteobacteria bacterium]